MPRTSPRRMRLDALKPFPVYPLLVESDGPYGVVNMFRRTEADIGCLPTGEVISGYDHYLALCEQEATFAKVIVLTDLATLPPDVQGLHVLRCYLGEVGADNALRARLFRVWDRWRLSLKWKGRRIARRRELDEQLQAILGVSRRTLLRHRAVQSLDPNARNLLSGLQLPNWALERISRLRGSQRQGLLTELQDAADVRDVLARYFPDRASRRHKKVSNALAAFVRNLKRGRADLEGREQEIGRLPADYAAELRATRALIDFLLGDGPTPGGNPA